MARSPSACYFGDRISLRLRTPTMTPAIVPFNSRRKYQVRARTVARGSPRLVALASLQTGGYEWMIRTAASSSARSPAASRVRTWVRCWSRAVIVLVSLMPGD